MDAAQIEVLLEDLGIPLPEKLARSRAVVDRLSVLDVPLRPMPSTKLLADTIRSYVTRDEEVDPVALARDAREAVDNDEAARAVQMALEEAVRIHDLGFRGGGGLIPTVRTGIEAVYDGVRALPNNTPTTDREAVHADEKARKAYVALEELAARHSQLRQLHRHLIADDVQGAPEQVVTVFVLFGETKLQPPAWPSYAQEAAPAGPRESLARVKWLAKAESGAWVPTGAEINARYFEALQALPMNRPIGITANKEA